MMRDRYFHASLAATLSVYVVIVAALCIFVLAAGPAGLLSILFVVVTLIVYFYKGPGNRQAP